MTASSATPPALLLMGSYRGTLAAVRSLGRHGVRVTVADPGRMAPAAWSKYAVRSIRCPDVMTRPEEFIAWLLEFGLRQPGHVLWATTDDLAWLFARYHDELSPAFRLAMPLPHVVDRLLDKARLAEVCRKVGISIPETWVPTSAADLSRPDPALRFPVVIKPRTQAFFETHEKGRLVREPRSLPSAYATFCSSARYAPIVRRRSPDLVLPMVQSFIEGARGIYSLTGFVDAAGNLLASAASRKLLQWPRGLGIGLCFEEAPVLPELVERTLQLCREVGYHGLFEAEYVETADRPLLIDFNQRFYGQMQFEIGRGLDMPLLSYLTAIGDVRALKALAERAQHALAARRLTAYCDGFRVQLALALMRLSRSGRADVERWRGWLSRNRGRLQDAVQDREDWKPAVIDMLTSILAHARHLRGALRAVREP